MKITFIGGGNMAAALVGGLCKQGHDRRNIRVVEPQTLRCEYLRTSLGIDCQTAMPKAWFDCHAFVIAVKPQQIEQALRPLASELHHQLVISIAAGVRIDRLKYWLDGHTQIVRTMPNTPALIGAGVTGMYADPAVQASGRTCAQTILRCTGHCLWVSEESAIDAVTAISGSGPAYVFYCMEALEKVAQELGFSSTEARMLAVETFRGASLLAASSEQSPATLREQVTSKGGTTEAALESLRADHVATAIGRAVHAAREKSIALGQD
jgi:pyrroline-5-carboxylate reductase